MRKPLANVVVTLCLSQLLTSTRASVAQDQTAGLRAKILSFATDTTLDAAGVRPWHWVMDVNLYDTEGNNPEVGTVEAWFADGNMRTTMKLAGAELTTLRVGSQLYRSVGDAKRFVPLEVAFMQALRPVPIEAQDSSLKMVLIQQSVGKTKVDCIQPTFRLPEADTFSAGTRLSFCAQQGVDQLLVTYMPGNLVSVRARTGRFLGKQVAVELNFSALSKKRFELKTSALATFTPSTEEFSVPATMLPWSEPVEVDPRDQLLGLILVKDPPHYPTEAKATHAQGSVRFDALVGTDGRIVSLQSINYASPALKEAARKAINNWVFRPYLLNGLPVKVKTVITMNFILSS